MKHAYLRFLPEEAVDLCKNAVAVLNQCWDIVVLYGTHSIPTMVSQVVDDQVKIVEQQ